jgi:hypothetical protein
VVTWATFMVESSRSFLVVPLSARVGLVSVA